MNSKESCRYFLLLAVLLIPVTATMATTTEQYLTEQLPATDRLEVQIGGSSKITFKLSTNESHYKLYAGFNGITFTNDAGYKNRFLTVTYNSCTDSNKPNERCMEAQISVKGTRSFNGSIISFYLYSIDKITMIPSVEKTLSTVTIVATNDTTQQVPSGNTVEVPRGATNKVTFRVWLNEPGYKLYAAFNGITFNSNAGYKSHFLNVVYNGCTDSDVPDNECMEAQVTIRGKRKFTGSTISFYLYTIDAITKLPVVEKELSTVTVMVENDSR